jgi:predicted peroxiredoxin
MKGGYEMAKLLINCTHGREDAERATLSFVVGNVAAFADQEVVVLLTIEESGMQPKAMRMKFARKASNRSRM